MKASKANALSPDGAIRHPTPPDLERRPHGTQSSHICSNPLQATPPADACRTQRPPRQAPHARCRPAVAAAGAGAAPQRLAPAQLACLSVEGPPRQCAQPSRSLHCCPGCSWPHEPRAAPLRVASAGARCCGCRGCWRGEDGLVGGWRSQLQGRGATLKALRQRTVQRPDLSAGAEQRHQPPDLQCTCR